ncbi:U-box domain-containing protein 33-like isoform x1 [Thalictrum thalictroides]|uniref:U-box domain-containing protein 33-like isoform x1 n=1 Tax=Thalictrum thalictroides TaxID=46969 RepID=A0A7J6W1B0_THATH|nr:U-box domain-containing protein 33-like isoform x1 [Thalictrum thalictroides]
MDFIMEEKKSEWSGEQHQYQNRDFMSPEIVEIDESKSFSSSTRDGGNNIYVAVGKDDLHVLKWILNHAVLPGTCVYLIHVFPPVNYIPTPVGKMLRSQASQEQVNSFLRDENTRRRNLLQKYVLLCNDAKVTVETMLIESNQTTKAILELIPVLNITMLVMGTKSPSSRKLRMRLGKGEFVQKHVPDFCEVTIIFAGKKVIEGQEELERSQEPSGQEPSGRGAEKNFFDCVCFSGKFN